MREFIRERLKNPDTGSRFREEDLWAPPPEMICVDDTEDTVETEENKKEYTGELLSDEANSGDGCEELTGVNHSERTKSVPISRNSNPVNQQSCDNLGRNNCDTNDQDDFEIVDLSSDESIEEVPKDDSFQVVERRMELMQTAVNQVVEPLLLCQFKLKKSGSTQST